MRRNSREFLIVLGLLLPGVVLAGCGAGSPEDDGAAPAFAEELAAAIEEAREGGASQAQIDILTRASAAGSIDLEDARATARAAVSCMVESGLVAEYDERTTNAGLVQPGYRAQIDDERPDLETTIDDCDRQEFSWVNKLYQLQPSSIEMTDAYFEKQAPLFLACLTEHGADVDESTSKRELLESAEAVLKDTNGETDCFVEAGLDGV